MTDLYELRITGEPNEDSDLSFGQTRAWLSLKEQSDVWMKPTQPNPDQPYPFENLMRGKLAKKYEVKMYLNGMKVSLSFGGLTWIVESTVEEFGQVIFEALSTMPEAQMERLLRIDKEPNDA